MRSLPRILESILLGFNPVLIDQFTRDHCEPDCVYELHVHCNGTNNANARCQSMVFNPTTVKQLLEHLHRSIPDAIFLVHESQFLSKPKGMQIHCKFSFSGYVIFDSDLDAQSLNSHNPSSKHINQLQQVVTSIDSAIPSVSMDHEILYLPIKKSIQFTGDCSLHSNEGTKRKFSTVGKYINSTHLDASYEKIKRSASEKPFSAYLYAGASDVRKPDSQIAATPTSLTQEDSDTSSPAASTDLHHFYQTNFSQSSCECLSRDSADNSQMQQLARDDQDTVRMALESVHESDHLFLGNKRKKLRTIIPGETKAPALTAEVLAQSHEHFTRHLQQVHGANDVSRPTDHLSFLPSSLFSESRAKSPSLNSLASSEGSFTYDASIIPSIFHDAPRAMQSGGVLKITLNDKTKRIVRMECTAYCT